MTVIPGCDFATTIGIALCNAFSFYRASHHVPKITVSGLKIVDRHEQIRDDDRGLDIHCAKLDLYDARCILPCITELASQSEFSDDF
jgi:hypothetical protein